MKKRKNLKLIVGTRLVTVDGFEVLAYPTDRQAYGRLSRLLTQGNLKAKKGECHLSFEDILADIRKRDERDSHRSAAPLVQADDAVLLDTSKMSISQAADAARRIVEAARAR